MNNAIQKINLLIENFIPYETRGSIEPIESGYKVQVSFFDIILNKMVDKFLYFTRKGDLIEN